MRRDQPSEAADFLTRRGRVAVIAVVNARSRSKTPRNVPRCSLEALVHERAIDVLKEGLACLTRRSPAILAAAWRIVGPDRHPDEHIGIVGVQEAIDFPAELVRREK